MVIVVEPAVPQIDHVDANPLAGLLDARRQVEGRAAKVGADLDEDGAVARPRDHVIVDVGEVEPAGDLLVSVHACSLSRSAKLPYLPLPEGEMLTRPRFPVNPYQSRDR